MTGPSRETLQAQVEALRAVVERQRHAIASMRASHFWKVRDCVFAVRARLGLSGDPLPELTADERAATAAALGDPYQTYRAREQLLGRERDRLHRFAAMLPAGVPIEVVVDARAAARAQLAATLRSLGDQIYPFWSVRLHAGVAERALLPELLTESGVDPARVHGAEAAELPGGDTFLCTIDAGDMLEPDALFQLAAAIHEGADVVYTDEDVVGEDGVPTAPAFKPDWSPETALSRDLVGRLCAFRASTLAVAGGIDPAHGSAAWYDALLRVTETTDRVAHVPRVLYHRAGDTFVRAGEGCAAVVRALARRGEAAEVHSAGDGWDVRFAVPGGERVAIVIPTRDRADLLGRCLASVFTVTEYANIEVVVVDNGSREAATRELFAHWEAIEPTRFRVVTDPAPFNFSRLVNAGVAATDAPYVLLLNNDTEAIAGDWLTAMLGQGRRAPIGAVGALLLYEDRTVQHAGVILGGVLGLAGHAYRYADADAAPLPPALRFDTNYLAVTGACLLVARAKFLAVGGFDEELAVSYNDVDFCLKLRAAGYRNVLVPRARLLHHESKSRGFDDTPAKVARMLREVGVIRERWTAWSQCDPYYNPNLTLDAEDFSLGR